MTLVRKWTYRQKTGQFLFRLQPAPIRPWMAPSPLHLGGAPRGYGYVDVCTRSRRVVGERGAAVEPRNLVRGLRKLRRSGRPFRMQLVEPPSSDRSVVRTASAGRCARQPAAVRCRSRAVASAPLHEPGLVRRRARRGQPHYRRGGGQAARGRRRAPASPQVAGSLVQSGTIGATSVLVVRRSQLSRLPPPSRWS